MVFDYARSDVATMARWLAAKEVSAVELTRAAIDQIERSDGAINAVVARDFDAALTAAAAADAAIADGTRKPLLGIPITVKEAHRTARMPTTWGIGRHAGWQATQDSTAVSRLKGAGAILLGKTNVPPMLADWQTDNPVYGRTDNPHRPGVTPGGSSGGSAAAVASGMVPLELGSDSGGSIRVPAHFCGIFGHRPTWGLVPTDGHAPPGAGIEAPMEFNTIGPLAKTAADLILALRLLAGPPASDWGWSFELPPTRHARLADFRVLVLDRHPTAPVGDDVGAAIHRLAQDLSARGLRVDHGSPLLPDLGAISERFLDMASVPIGLMLEKEADAPPSMSAESWLVARNMQEQVRRQWRTLFRDYDVVLAPPFGSVAFPHDERPLFERTLRIEGAETSFAGQIGWQSIASFPGLPVTCVPLGLTADGLPTGVQVIGPQWEDLTCLHFATLLQHELGVTARLATGG